NNREIVFLSAGRWTRRRRAGSRVTPVPSAPAAEPSAGAAWPEVGTTGGMGRSRKWDLHTARMAGWRMNFTTVLKDPFFLSYTISAAVLLAAAWGALTYLQRPGPRRDDDFRIFWTWVVMVGLITLGILLGKEVFALLVALLALFACKEFARATGLYDDWIFTGCVYLAIVIVNLVALWPGY